MSVALQIIHRHDDQTTLQVPLQQNPLIIFMKFNYSDTDRWTCCQWGHSSFVSSSRHVSPEVMMGPRLCDWKQQRREGEKDRGEGE